MKYRAVAFLIIASTVAGVTVAQDGSGTGPPKRSVVMVSPLPTSSATTAPAPTTLQSTLR
jgi:hypothetical protein